MRKLRQIAAGFTLIELTMVIAIASILAAFAIARINTTSFHTEGFANRAAAMVRYAQKLAISQRRLVYVIVASNNIKLCYDSGCGTPVPEPVGAITFSYDTPSGVLITAGTGTYIFDRLGRPVDSLGVPTAGGTITLTGDIARSITIEAQTGYVH